ncbi:MAG: VCBS repeat-containing protein [Mucilaginibacter polytrichastri]|nr:VCBS repeat-containing protein [Mucilaginibacter polytrichastri]
MKRIAGAFFTLVFLVSLGCTKKTGQPQIFKKLPAGKTNIQFANTVTESDSVNILDYLYFYNGAGVASGDFNRDGLEDLYFVSNQGENKLYLNKGNMQFEDITAKAGVQGKGNWKTGVTVADVNGDGYPDIYLSVVSEYKTFKGRNQLFINNGDLTFTERAAEYGVDFAGLSTQAAFFDYDKDGDLDLFILTHSVHSNDTYGDSTLRFKYNEIGGDHLYRNDGGHFTDVTKGSGIYAAPIGYGLGIAIADLNNDGWDDIYISNDFFEQDYYYINQKNGTFEEQLKQAFGHTSLFSMGNAVADFNGDGQLDVLTTDMLPDDIRALKSTITDEAPDIYNMEVKAGYYYQYSKNSLQLNVANGQKFVDIGLYAGMSATDWTWSPLVHDFDMDGRKDIFFSNGIKKRLNDLDYLKYLGSNISVKEFNKTRVFDQDKIDHMPDGRVHNFFFRGDSAMRFSDISALNDMKDNSASSGSIAVDLDNDGDLDIVTNNMDEPAFVYLNQTMENAGAEKPAWISFSAHYKTGNPQGIGTKFYVRSAGKTDHQEMQTSAGFQSGRGTLPYFTFTAKQKPEEMLVIWPDNSTQIIRDFRLNTKQEIRYDEKKTVKTDSLPQLISRFVAGEAEISHKNIAVKQVARVEPYETPDFNYYSLIPHNYQPHTPAVAAADIDGDGFDDLYIGGAEDQPKYLLMGGASGFRRVDVAAFSTAKTYTDAFAEWADLNGDKKPDLIVHTQNHPFSDKKTAKPSRVYLNLGNGQFREQILPAVPLNSRLYLWDANGDGQTDLLFCGAPSLRDFGRKVPPLLLLNDGHAGFSPAQENFYSEIGSMPLLRDIVVADVDGNGKEDLIIAAEWQELTLLLNDAKKLSRSAILPGKKGWWQSLLLADVDGDGKPDLLAGNWGLNNKFNVTEKTPLKAYVQDLDKDGKTDFILSYAHNGKYYPFRPKNDLEQELPYMKKEWLSYQKMADKTTEEVFGSRLDQSAAEEANCFESLFISDIRGKKTAHVLPWMYQQAPIMSFAKIRGEKGSGKLLVNGNFQGVVPYEGRYDALGLVNLRWDARLNAIAQPEYLINANFNAEEITWLRTIKSGVKTACLAMTHDGRLFLLGD